MLALDSPEACSFCPELMLEGDDLFAELCKLLEACGFIVWDLSKAAVEKLSSYVVKKRRHYVDSGDTASAIPDIIDNLLRDFDFQSRHRLLQVFKIGCLLVRIHHSDLLPVSFDLPGCALDPAEFRRCLCLMQSCVLSSG